MGNYWRREGSKDYPLVVSFFTDELYRRECWGLARSCQALGLSYEIEDANNLGTWVANTNYKPVCLLAASKRHPDRDLLWLDADARVLRMPELFRGWTTTIAYHTWHGKP